MTTVLGENRYGKSRVRVMKVTRDAANHHVVEWNIEVWLEGDFQSCFEDGDNSKLLPTDTMKNTVYSLARATQAVSMEGFALELVSHFIESNAHAQLAGVQIKATPWKQLVIGDELFPTAFTHGEDFLETTTVTRNRSGKTIVVSGFENMWLLKTAKSGFAGYIKDRLTTLKETSDRLFGTLAKVEWQYEHTGARFEDDEFPALRKKATVALIKTFAEHESLSVQQTLYAMAGAALGVVSEIGEVHLSLPNKHCNLIDLSHFGQDNPNQIFVPTDEPHGSISARVRRDD